MILLKKKKKKAFETVLDLSQQASFRLPDCMSVCLLGVDQRGLEYFSYKVLYKHEASLCFNDAQTGNEHVVRIQEECAWLLSNLVTNEVLNDGLLLMNKYIMQYIKAIIQCMTHF